MSNIIQRAREVFAIEIDALQKMSAGLDERFEATVQECIQTVNRGGKLVLTGIGKSGHIGKKIAATLSSVGAPSIFLHPVEALHGDLGIIQKNDLILAISYSGETEELLGFIAPAKRFGVRIIALTGNAESSLAKLCDLVLPTPVPQEACPFRLAPTASTTALLAMGDALAMVILQERGFTKENYGRLHPGGAIGRAVTLRAADVMRSGDRSAIVPPEMKLRDALYQMSEARCGAAIIADVDGKLLGIFTDGDFRRLAKSDISALDRQMQEIMTRNPVHVRANALAVEVLKLVEERHVNGVIVVDEENRVQGLIDVQDLPGLKLM